MTSKKFLDLFSASVNLTPPLSDIFCIWLQVKPIKTVTISNSAAVIPQRMKHPFGLSSTLINGPTDGCAGGFGARSNDFKSASLLR